MATTISSLPTTSTVYRCEATRLGVAVTTWPESGGSCISYVTGCCGADVTGAGDGTVCRACHRVVPSLMGAPVDLIGWESLVADLGCPCPAECATTVAWKTEQVTDRD